MDKNEKQAYLSFVLDEEIFALSVHKVLEVLEFQKITKVPNTPDYIHGVINFRGDILPVVDTRTKFNLPPEIDNSKKVIIVLEIKVKDKTSYLGAIADGVRDVMNVDVNSIKAVPDIGNAYNTEFLEGMIKTEQGFIMILNIDKVFSVEEINLIDKHTENAEDLIENEDENDENEPNNG